MPQDQPKQTLPPQHQDHRPGTESEMHPKPEFESNEYKATGKLKGKVALITGGDSGIGRAVAVYYAKEGADVSIVYLNEHKDAEETKRQVEQEGRKCLLIAGDVGDDAFAAMRLPKPWRSSVNSIFSLTTRPNSIRRRKLRILPKNNWSGPSVRIFSACSI